MNKKFTFFILIGALQLTAWYILAGFVFAGYEIALLMMIPVTLILSSVLYNKDN